MDCPDLVSALAWLYLAESTVTLIQGVNSLSIPTYKGGITALPLFNNVQRGLWHLYWAKETTLTNTLMLLHKLGISGFHIWVIVTISTRFRCPFIFFMILSYTYIFCRLSSQNQNIYREVVIAEFFPMWSLAPDETVCTDFRVLISQGSKCYTSLSNTSYNAICFTVMRWFVCPEHKWQA